MRAQSLLLANLEKWLMVQRLQSHCISQVDAQGTSSEDAEESFSSVAGAGGESS